MYWWLFLLCPLAYLLGGFNVSKTITKIRHVDLSNVGSGNAGATNVGRAMGFKWFLLVIFLEMFKCVSIILLGYLHASFCTGNFAYIRSEPHYIIILAMGLSAVFGSIFPVWYKFKGGKGIATWIGLGFFLNPLVMLVAAALLIPLLLITRYMSVSTLLGLIFWVIFSILFEAPQTTPVIILYCCFLPLIFYSHRANIGRIFTGTEKKVFFKKESKVQK